MDVIVAEARFSAEVAAMVIPRIMVLNGEEINNIMYVFRIVVLFYIMYTLFCTLCMVKLTVGSQEGFGQRFDASPSYASRYRQKEGVAGGEIGIINSKIVANPWMYS